MPQKNLALPKAFVHYTNYFGTVCMHYLLVLFEHSQPCVLYTLQEEVKCRGDEISNSTCYDIGGELIQVQSSFWNVYWDRHFWNRRGALTPESFNQALDGKNLFSLRFLYGTFFQPVGRSWRWTHALVQPSKHKREFHFCKPRSALRLQI